MLTIDGIVLAGGLGSRFSGGQTSESHSLLKQFSLLDGKPVLIHSVDRLLSLDCLRQIVIATAEPYRNAALELIHHYLPEPPVPIKVVSGGVRRQDSSRLALESIEDGAPTRVLIHDACRPVLCASFLTRIRERLFDRAYGAWIPVLPVSETLKHVENGIITQTVHREKIFWAQTPQIFEYSVIRATSEQSKAVDLTFTDDASLCEYLGIPVGVFEGDSRNVKLTFPFELEALRAYLKEEKARGERAPCESESGLTYTA